MILLKYFMYGILASGILIFIAKVLLYGIAHRDGDYYEIRGTGQGFLKRNFGGRALRGRGLRCG